LSLGALVGLFGTGLGFLFAFTVARANLRPGWLRLLDAVSLLPLVSPPFTTSISFIFSFGSRGLISYELFGMRGSNVYGLRATLAAEVLTYFPIAYLALRPVLTGIGSNLEEMAFSLGSKRLNVFWTVTLPLAIPGIANAFLLLFAASLADFATPLILAGNAFPVLPTEAYLQITGLFDLKGGAVLSVLLLVPAAIVYAFGLRRGIT
jgi:iron(III) transport system permease protein